jgi:hypothetical protein
MSLESSFEDDFGEVFHLSWLNLLLVGVALTSLVINVIGSVGSVWYLRYFVDVRNLMKKLMENVSWSGLEFLVVIHFFDILRYLFGPFDVTICQIHLTVKNAFSIQLSLYLSAINLVRYRLAFQFNRMSQLQESFWNFLLNVWILSFSFITQALYVYLPGKQPLTFYLCCGKKPPPMVDTSPTKVNIVSICLHLVCLAFHLFVTLKMNISQYKLARSQDSTTLSRFLLRSLHSSMLVLTLGINLFLFLVVMFKANSLKMSEVNQYPNYFYIHGMLIIYPVFSTTTLTIVFYLKNHDMMNAVLSQTKQLCK